MLKSPLAVCGDATKLYRRPGIDVCRHELDQLFQLSKLQVDVSRLDAPRPSSDEPEPRVGMLSTSARNEANSFLSFLLLKMPCKATCADVFPPTPAIYLPSLLGLRKPGFPQVREHTSIERRLTFGGTP